MNNNNTLILLSQLIDRTKSDQLSWDHYSESNYELKPLPHSPLSNSISIATAVLSPEHSYVCSHNEGYFFLLLYKNLGLSSKLELRVQTKNSHNSKICASSITDSKEDVEVSAMLKRLYNLIDTSTATVEIDDFINDFISNE